jgi:hypothetical protein
MKILNLESLNQWIIMTHDNFIRVGVPIHYYDNVPIHNDQNNTSIEEHVDAQF